MTARATRLSQEILHGPILSSLLRLAWPVMLSNLFQTLYNFVDRFWLARSSTVAIAGLQLAWPLIFLVISLGAGMTVAGTALVAQYTGAQRRDQANLAAGQVLSFTLALSFVLALVGVLIARPILGLMGAEPALMAASSSYLRIIFAGIPLTFGTFIVTSLLNGAGDTLTPMILMSISVAANIVLDPFFIFGWGPFPEWGISGAAIATLISRGLITVVGFALLFSGRAGLHIRRHHLRPRWKMIRHILSIGGLASIGQTGTALGFSIMNGALARIGTSVLGAFGIGNSFISLVLMPSMGLGQATATMVGQNLGATQPHRARRSAWTGMALSSSILSIAAVFVILFRGHLIQFFTADLEVIRLGRDMLLLVGFAFPFMGIIEVVRGTYQGSGHTGYSMGFDLFRLWALRVPLVYILAFTLGMAANGVWWAMLASNFGTALVSLLFFMTGNWEKRVVRPSEIHLESSVDSAAEQEL